MLSAAQSLMLCRKEATSEAVAFPKHEVPFHAVRRKSGAMGLELIVGVDIEADNYTDLDRLITTQSGAEFPTVERGENFAGHHC